MSPLKRALVTFGVMLGTFLAAMDVMVVGTAMPSIIGMLGGISIYTWVFSAYLLTSTTTMPIYGKLADLYGRKRIYALGAGFFLVGSALCGLARSMETLILFRAIQGLGAGAVQPLGSTILGDIYSPTERAKMQGLFSAVWGLASIVGPLVGGIIVDRYSWPWVFYVNLPFGVLSILIIALYLEERVQRTVPVFIDYWGVASLAGGITALLFALMMLGGDQGLGPGLGVALFALAVLLVGLFLWNEGRTPEPIMPLALFLGNRTIGFCSLAGFLSGMAMLGVTSFMPLFVQGVMGGSATNAGAVLTPLAIGWSLGSIMGGRLLLLMDYRASSTLGLLLMAAGSFLLTRLVSSYEHAFAVTVMTLIGLGLGFSSTSFIVAVQSAVGWSQRGVATSSLQFFRSIGNALGAGLLGGLLNTQLASHLARLSLGGLPIGVGRGAGLSRMNSLLDPSSRLALPPEAQVLLRQALAASLTPVFWAVLLFAILGLVAVLFLPKGSIQRDARGY